MNFARGAVVALFLAVGNFSNAGPLTAGMADTPLPESVLADAGGAPENTNPASTSAPHEQTEAEKILQRKLLAGLIAGLLLLGVVYHFKRRRESPAR